MAKTVIHRVDLELDLPDWLLSHPELPPAILEARRAFEKAQDEVYAALDKVQEIKDEIAANKAAIRRAIEEGKEPPAPIPEVIANERIRNAEMNVRRALNRAVDAAEAYERLIPEYREVLRPILAAKLPELAAKAADAIREAEAANNAARGAASLIRTIDRRVAMSAPPAHQHALLALVDSHYARADRKDAGYLDRRLTRIRAAWDDVKAVVTGLPVDEYLADPLANPDIQWGRELRKEQARARAKYEARILGDI